ncbi:MAG TPA: carboxypeptidase-like regulatory domain-containing protein, partial [Methylomirabilota bacterium]
MLRGVVVGGENGRPLRRAVVRLYGPALREGRMTSTDEDGRWELSDLPAGRFNLTASKAGYVSLQYGQRRPFEPGRPVELRSGQTLEHVSFNLPRGAVISGRIVDEFGDPVAEAMVTAMRYRFFNGRRRLIPAGRVSQTDDLGQFRIYGLPPGDYFVSATMRGDMTFGMESDSRAGYAPTYYPGTGSAQQAQRISVPLGGETSGITFPLMPVRTVRISGTALDAEGRPMAGAMVILTETMESAGGAMMFSMGGGNRVRDDGSFTLSNVSPGEYMLEAQRMQPGPNSRQDVATATVSVGTEDLTDVMLVASQPATLSGQLVIDVPPTSGGVRPGGIELSAQPKDDASAFRYFRSGGGT